MLNAFVFKRFMICTLILSFLLGIAALSAQTSALRKPVTLNSVDEPLSSVLSTLARLSGTNIVLATDQSAGTEKEQKRVTVSIKDVPVETAVSLVAKSAGLSYKIYGDNTFLVGTQQNIAESSGHRSNIIYLKNLDAAKVSEALANSEVSVVPLEGQNAIMVYGNTDTFESVRDLVQTIDIAQKQIEIRVRLIEISLTDAKKFGIDWSRLNHLTTVLAEDPVNAEGTGLPYNFSDSEGYLPYGNPTDFEILPDQQYFQRINGFNDIGHFSRQLTAFDITIDWLLENNAAKPRFISVKWCPSWLPTTTNRSRSSEKKWASCSRLRPRSTMKARSLLTSHRKLAPSPNWWAAMYPVKRCAAFPQQSPSPMSIRSSWAVCLAPVSARK